MSHEHGEHRHRHDEAVGLSDSEKLTRMMEHWIRHNEEHEGSYRDWAGRARSLGHEKICRILEDVARIARDQTRLLEEALSFMKDDPSSH